MVLLSIIIPHYNSTDTLNRLLNTLPASNEVEVIIVDDKSSEFSKANLNNLEKKYSHKNIRFFSNKSKKKGAGSCRNIGLIHATGKWVIFADADDYFITDFFEVLKKYLNTDYDVVYFKPTSVEEDTGKVSNRHLKYEKLIENYINKPNNDAEIRLRYMFVVPWSKLIKMDLIKENNIYFDEVIASNDIMFSTKVGHSLRNFHLTDEVIYCVTKSKGSLTTKISHEVFNSRLDTYIRYYRYLKEHCLTRKEFKKIKINLSGRSFLLNSKKLGYKKVLWVYKELRKNKIHIIDIEYFNPLFFVRKLLSFYKKYKYAKGYHDELVDKGS